MTEALGNVSVRGRAAVSRSVCAAVLRPEHLPPASSAYEVVSLVEMRRKLPEGGGGRVAAFIGKRQNGRGSVAGGGARSSVGML